MANYLDGLSKYREVVDALGYQETFAAARVEAQYECIMDWSQVASLDDVKNWYQTQKEQVSMNVSDIPLNQCSGWSIDSETGNVSHESGDFFIIHGLRIQNSIEREVVGGWDQPILTQVGFDGGLLGIIRKRINGVPHYLLEAKAEPGNYGLVLISPTLQATFSNLKRAHKGKKPAFSEYFEDPDKQNAKVLFSQWMSEDGGRFNKKRNKGMLVEVSDECDLEVPDSFAWFSLWQIKELIKEDAWVNPHVRSIISHL